MSRVGLIEDLSPYQRKLGRSSSGGGHRTEGGVSLQDFRCGYMDLIIRQEQLGAELVQFTKVWEAGRALIPI